MAKTTISKKPEPRHVLVVPTKHTVEIRLRWGADLLLFPNGAAMSGALFHALRDSLCAQIRTDQPEKVCQALGLSFNEPGIFRLEEVR